MKKIELLSPVGDFECLKAAVQNGANSVYLGASSFSARAKATNFNIDELKKAISYAKTHNVSVHLTLNTLIKNSEFEEAVSLAIKAYNAGVDTIIIQDLGLAKYLLQNFPEIPIHASTQMTIHNLAGAKQLEKMGFSRAVLSRELSIDEIEYIRKNTSLELEVFIHGALCISFSGQCLFSSMIGGRSGNRGLCAQPCRLPYELISSDGNSLNSGYLLSPKDTCGIEFLPELIKMGIDSFKIEGRMKTPLYVATVTKIYRKYIDYILENINLDNNILRKNIEIKLSEIDSQTGLSDKESLAQVFNRGGFGTGHFSKNPNKKLIYKQKPNNMGIFIGTIQHFNENKGHITLKLDKDISIGDKISINNELYTISELMIKNQNFQTIKTGNIVKIGRMKGNLSVGNKIYRIESSLLAKNISPTFKEDKEFKKIPLKAKISIKKDEPITLKVWSTTGYYDGIISEIYSNIIPDSSINRPLKKEDILKQLSKTGNTPFEFENIDIILDDNLFIPKLSILNDLRRNALSELENKVIEKYSHNLHLDTITFPMSSQDNNSKKNIHILLNKINLDFDYSNLNHINKLYIPFKFFEDGKYKSILKVLSNKFEMYIYMSNIMLDNINDINYKLIQNRIDKILNNYKIKGFVISNISQMYFLQNYKLDFIGNFNLNIFNAFTINELMNLNLKSTTISPELNVDEINENCNIFPSLIVIAYGILPLMTNRYCYLGESNHCYSSCSKKCLENKEYFLKDRKGFYFPILPDNTSTITTIYHNKPLKIESQNIQSKNIRLDFLDENLEKMQEIINNYYNL